MCAAVADRVCVVIVYKDWNKASKSKRHGLLHHRVQVPTLWVSLNVSEAELRMKDSTISDRER